MRGLSLCVILLVSSAHAGEQQRLREEFTPGQQHHVSVRVQINGSLTLPADAKAAPKVLTIIGSSAIEYDERILAINPDRSVPKTVRQYQRMDFERKVGDQHQQNSLRPEVRRLVILRRNQMEVPFSPAGPMLWGELDLVRTDVFAPALSGLLPEHAVMVGSTWKAASSALQELTDLDRIDEGELVCRYETTSTIANRRLAKIVFQGNVRGLGEDGPTRHRLEGSFYFDLESRHLSYLSMKGVQDLLDKTGKELGKVEGTFVLTRRPVSSRELSDDALRGLSLEPNDDNTQLLFENTDLGVRFLHSRRWRVAGVNPSTRQITLDEQRGSGLILTVEKTDRLPSATQFQNEVRNWLNQQKATIYKIHPYPTSPGVEHFAIDANVMKERVWLDYYIVRQPQGGATVAARLLPSDLANLQRDVQRVIGSLQVTAK